MSTITLEVPDELLERIRAKAQDAGQDSNVFAVAAMVVGLDTLEADDQSTPDTWFESLTPEQQERHLANLDKSLADGDAGRTVNGRAAFQRLREKYGLR